MFYTLSFLIDKSFLCRSKNKNKKWYRDDEFRTQLRSLIYFATILVWQRQLSSGYFTKRPYSLSQRDYTGRANQLKRHISICFIQFNKHELTFYPKYPFVIIYIFAKINLFIIRYFYRTRNFLDPTKK